MELGKLFAGAVCAMAMAAPALAYGAPPASAYVSVAPSPEPGVNPTYTSEPSGVEELYNAGGQSGEAAIYYTPDNGVMSQVDEDTGPIDTISAVTSFQYYVDIEGPADLVVPILFSASLSTSGNVAANDGSLFDSEAQINVEYNGNDLSAVTASESPNIDILYPGDIGPEATINTTLYVPEDGGIFVSLGANAEVAGSGSALAFIDPIFTIDPAFLSQNPGYALDFSPGIGDGPIAAAPEPDTWAMMMAGLFCLGATLRSARRRQLSASAAANT